MSYKSLPSVFTSDSIHTFLEMRSAANKSQICIQGKRSEWQQLICYCDVTVWDHPGIASSSSLSLNRPSWRVIQLPASIFKERREISTLLLLTAVQRGSCVDAAVFCLCGGKLVVVAEVRAVVVSLCVTSSRCLGRLHGNLPNMLTLASCLTVSLLLSPSPQTFFTSPSPRAPCRPPASPSV